MKRTYLTWITGCIAIAVACAFAGAAYAQDATYVGESQCKMCHNKKDEGEQWNKWKAEKHAQAFETLKSPKAAEVAKAKGITKPPSEAPECLKCHATAFDGAKCPDKILPASGVQCEACHGPASKHVEEGKKAMMKKDPAAKPKEAIHKGDAETCKKCHNDQNPTFNKDRYTLKDGSKADFDYDQAYAKIAHPNPKKAAEKK